MPILHWLDRDKTIKQTGRAPYRLPEIDPNLSCGDQNSQNILIQGDNLELTESEICLDANGLSLLEYSTVLTKEEFTVDEEAKQYITDIVDQKIKIDFLNKSEQLSLEGTRTEPDEIGLCRWTEKTGNLFLMAWKKNLSQQLSNMKLLEVTRL